MIKQNNKIFKKTKTSHLIEIVDWYAKNSVPYTYKNHTMIKNVDVFEWNNDVQVLNAFLGCK